MVLTAFTDFVRALAVRRHAVERRTARLQFAQIERLESRWVMSGQNLLAGNLIDDHADGEPHSFPTPSEDVILATSTPPAPGPAPLADTFRLHSNPDANHTIYLDFDGHVTTGTQWNTWKNISSFTTAAWDPSGDGAPQNATELAMIQGIWQRVAEDFAPFNVDVTTEDPGPDALKKSDGGDTRWGIRVVITPTDWSSSSVGGHAWVGSFNSAVDETCYIYNPTEITVAAAVSHEVGHTMFLSHDGQNSTTYYNGHGFGETSWGPIMGSGYYSNVTTWDTGSYYATNNTGATANYSRGADDFAVITTMNGFSYLADDHGDSQAAATDLVITGTNSAFAGRYDVGSYGIIGLGTDQDFFRFTVGAGTIDLTIDSYYSRFYASNGDGTYDLGYSQTPVGSNAVRSQGSNLDVLATLYDFAGNVVALSNPAGLSASFTNMALVAGTYVISVDGTGFGNWATTPPSGYSDTVSVGQYYIRGSIVKPVAANTDPVANDDAVTTNEDTLVTISVLTNDTDANGDALTVTSTTQPSHGTLVINADGTVTYTPLLNANGPDTFTYTISDGHGGSAVGSVSVTITPVNDAPTANTDTVTTNEDIAATFNLLTNDSDQDGDAITLTGTSTPANGTITFSDNGDATYTPVANYFGPDTFTYTVRDTHGATSTATVTVTVHSINDQPVALNDTVTTYEDTPISVAVLANDYDTDGGTLTVTAKTNGTRGTVVIVNGSTVAYTPNANANGSDSFTYTISDGQGGTTTGTVSVTITPVNDAPTAVNDTATTSETTPITISVLANDSDIEANPLTSVLITGPASGSAVVNPNGTITYTANAGFSGTDTFTYQASDGVANSGAATVTISVLSSTKFFVVDSGTDQAYRYQSDGAFTTATSTSSLNRSAVGIASNADGSRLWVMDSNRTVYVYDASMTLLGSWTASDLKTPKGISVNGSDVWIVDAGKDRVYVYSGATSVLSGSQTPTRNFQLATTNGSSEDIVTNGTTVWVLQSGSPDKVFAYRNSDGFALGNWTIDSANTNPVGITLDQTNASQSLWIVDSAKDRVYEYTNARSRFSGVQTAATSFALNSGNTTPQGIAWIYTSTAAPPASSVPASSGTLSRTSTTGKWAADGDGGNDDFVDDEKMSQRDTTVRSRRIRLSSSAFLPTRPVSRTNDASVTNRELLKSLDSVFSDEFLWQTFEGES